MKTFEKFFKCFKFLEKKLFSGRKNFHCQSFYYFVVLFFYSCIHVPTCCSVLHLLSRPNPPPLAFFCTAKGGGAASLFLHRQRRRGCFAFFAKQKNAFGGGQSPPRCGLGKAQTQAKKSTAAPGVLAKLRRKQF